MSFHWWVLSSWDGSCRAACRDDDGEPRGSAFLHFTWPALVALAFGMASTRTTVGAGDAIWWYHDTHSAADALAVQIHGIPHHNLRSNKHK